MFNQLAPQNLHSALKIVTRLQNRLLRIVFRQLPVILPIELAPISIRIFIRQLQKALAAHHPMTYAVLHCDFRLRVLHIRGRPQASLRA